MNALIRAHFPELAEQEIRRVEPGGWDNSTFRVGEGFAARLPNDDAYAMQVATEHAWLPRLAPALPLSIPESLAVVGPTATFPRPWSLRRWVAGTPLSRTTIRDLEPAARHLAHFLTALQGVSAEGGPSPGPANFHRGGDLCVYDGQVRAGLRILEGRIDERAALRLWDEATARPWRGPPVWVHGDVGPDNMITVDGRLVAVLDFGQLAVGDPACDFTIAWTVFPRHARDVYLDLLHASDDTRLRARAWALWKGVIVASALSHTNASEWRTPLAVIENVLHFP